MILSQVTPGCIVTWSGLEYAVTARTSGTVNHYKDFTLPTPFISQFITPSYTVPDWIFGNMPALVFTSAVQLNLSSLHRYVVISSIS